MPKTVDRETGQVRLTTDWNEFALPYMTVAGYRLRGSEESVETLISRLFSVLQEAAFGANKPVMYGNTCQMVPDHRLRVEAALKLLQFVEPIKPSADLPRSDTVVAKETVTREVRRTRRN